MSLRILYYQWGEILESDGTLALEKSGHAVFPIRCERTGFDYDEAFIGFITGEVRKKEIDLIFTFDYFPDLSRAAMQENIKYVSWCYDSPHRTLDSVTLKNPCNHVFLFDYALYEKYKGMGIETVDYMPLACNVERVQKVIREKTGEEKVGYQHEITFLGNMYDDEYNFFSQIGYLPDYIKGYLDAAMEAQTLIYGMDMLTPMLRSDICEEVFKYVNINMGSDYRECRKEILVSMLQKQITSMERRKLLTVLGENFQVDHYADKKAENLPVSYKGYASYTEEMPVIFATSKINLNISLRSIQTGIPLRVIDILGAGGFCISNYQAELQEYFENGKSIVWYESYEDLFEKVLYYLKHDAERERIAAAGHEIVKECFTYERMISRMLEKI